VRNLLLDLDVDYDSIQALLVESCEQPALTCTDFNTELSFASLAAGRYFLVVDGFFDDEEGNFTLKVSGEIVPGGSCETPLFDSGALVCADGLTCQGVPG